MPKALWRIKKEDKEKELKVAENATKKPRRNKLLASMPLNYIEEEEAFFRNNDINFPNSECARMFTYLKLLDDDSKSIEFILLGFDLFSKWQKHK